MVSGPGQHWKDGGLDFKGDLRDRIRIIRRVTVDLPSMVPIEFEPNLPSRGVDQPWIPNVATKASSNQPTRQLPTTLAGQNHQIEFSIVRAGLPSQIESPRVLPTIGHHRQAPHPVRHPSTVHLDLHHRGNEITKLPQGGPKVGKVADGTGTNGGQIMDHFRIEAEGCHQHHDFIRTPRHHRPAQIDPMNLSVDQIFRHRRGLGGHPVIAGEEILVARRAMNERYVGSNGFGGGQSDRSVPAHHDEGISTSERPSKPALRDFLAGGQQVDVETSGRRGGLNPLCDHASSPSPRNRIEDH